MKLAWGKIAAKAMNLTHWRKQDATKTWWEDDARKLVDEMFPKLHAVIADAVKEGVAEYATGAEYSLDVRDKVMWVDCRLWNDQSEIYISIPIRDLLNKAIADAYQVLGANPAAQEFVSHVHSLGRDINHVTEKMTGRGVERAASAQGRGGQIARRVVSTDHGKQWAGGVT